MINSDKTHKITCGVSRFISSSTNTSDNEGEEIINGRKRKVREKMTVG